MTLDTPRLTLRPFQPDDIDRLAELMANPDFMRFSLGVYDREKTSAFLDKIIGWEHTGIPSLFAVVIRPTPEETGSNVALVGYCGFYHHPPEVTEDIEIGYRLDPNYWNRGLITESALAVRDHAFRNLKLARVISLIHPENIPSRRVAEKIGMVLEKQIIYRGFPTNVFFQTRAQWATRSAA